MTAYFNVIWRNSYYKRNFINYVTQCTQYNRESIIINIDYIVKESIRNDITDINITRLIYELLTEYQNNTMPEMVNCANIICGLAGNVNRYLDYRRGSKSFSFTIGRLLDITDNNIYSINISDEDVNYSTRLVPNNSIDLITAMTGLHYFPRVNETINEIYRMLRPGGAFIVREHDFRKSRLLLSYLRVMYIYQCMEDGESNDDISDSLLYTTYRTKNMWDYKLISSGFIPGRYECDSDDPQRIYYASYIKV